MSTFPSIPGFRIISPLGAGGMAVVYRAWDLSLGREVAVKLMRAPLTDAAARQRFVREAVAMARIDHPHVVRIFAWSGLDEPLMYLVLELINGPNLLDWRRHHGPMPWEGALCLMEPLLDAIAALHQAGIIHRDLKPSNVFVVDSGVPKLGDLGVARLLDMTQLTASSHMVGTLLYLPPEALQPAQLQPDSSWDIYAAGCLLSELLQGKPAFMGGDVVQVVQDILSGSCPPLEQALQVPQPVADIVRRAMRIAPGERFLSAGEMRMACRGARASAGIEDAAIWLSGYVSAGSTPDWLTEDRRRRLRQLVRKARAAKRRSDPAVLASHVEGILLLDPESVEAEVLLGHGTSAPDRQNGTAPAGQVSAPARPRRLIIPLTAALTLVLLACGIATALRPRQPHLAPVALDRPLPLAPSRSAPVPLLSKRDLAARWDAWDHQVNVRRTLSAMFAAGGRGQGGLAGRSAVLRSLLSTSGIDLACGAPLTLFAEAAPREDRELYEQLLRRLSMARAAATPSVPERPILALFPVWARPAMPVATQGRPFEVIFREPRGLTRDPMRQTLEVASGPARESNRFRFSLVLDRVDRATSAQAEFMAPCAPTTFLRLDVNDRLKLALAAPAASARTVTHSLPRWALREGYNTFSVAADSYVEKDVTVARLESFRIVLCP